jgi:hypothetical protein
VLPLRAAGLRNEESARRLYVTSGPVKTQLKSISGPLGVHTRTETVARALALLSHRDGDDLHHTPWAIGSASIVPGPPCRG